MTPPPPCATCRKPAAREGNKWFPFCSERCSLVDLGRWLNEDYRVPSEDTVDPQHGTDDD